MRHLFLLLLATAALALVGCDDDDGPVDVEEPVLDERVIDTFMGTVEQGGSSINLFTVVGLNQTDLTITTLAPLETITMGLGVGTTADGGETCSFVAQDNSVRQGETLIAGTLSPGDYCVSVFDVGNIFPDQTVTYSIDVEHP